MAEALSSGDAGATGVRAPSSGELTPPTEVTFLLPLGSNFCDFTTYKTT